MRIYFTSHVAESSSGHESLSSFRGDTGTFVEFCLLGEIIHVYLPPPPPPLEKSNVDS